MSKIKIFGLGGLSETGKNTYVVEVDNSIFILDCGLKFATENLYGIDYIIPDFDYLLAGVPCQPFSSAGNRNGFADTRGTLFFEIERILQDKGVLEVKYDKRADANATTSWLVRL